MAGSINGPLGLALGGAAGLAVYGIVKVRRSIRKAAEPKLGSDIWAAEPKLGSDIWVDGEEWRSPRERR
eukprot:g67086.t1